MMISRPELHCGEEVTVWQRCWMGIRKLLPQTQTQEVPTEWPHHTLPPVAPVSPSQEKTPCCQSLTRPLGPSHPLRPPVSLFLEKTFSRADVCFRASVFWGFFCSEVSVLLCRASPVPLQCQRSFQYQSRCVRASVPTFFGLAAVESADRHFSLCSSFI